MNWLELGRTHIDKACGNAKHNLKKYFFNSLFRHLFTEYFRTEIGKKPTPKCFPHRYDQDSFFTVFAVATTRGLVHSKDSTVRQIYSINAGGSLRQKKITFQCFTLQKFCT